MKTKSIARFGALGLVAVMLLGLLATATPAHASEIIDNSMDSTMVVSEEGAVNIPDFEFEGVKINGCTLDDSKLINIEDDGQQYRVYGRMFDGQMKNVDFELIPVDISGNEDTSRERMYTQSDSDGVFIFEDVPNGYYVLLWRDWENDLGYEKSSGCFDVVSNEDSAWSYVLPPKGQNNKPVIDNEQDDDTYLVYGYVKKDGDMVSGAEVVILEKNSRIPLCSTVTDDTGRYEFKSIDTGRYVIALAENGEYIEDQALIAEGVDKEISINFRMDSTLVKNDGPDNDRITAGDSWSKKIERFILITFLIPLLAILAWVGMMILNDMKEKVEIQNNVNTDEYSDKEYKKVSTQFIKDDTDGAFTNLKMSKNSKVYIVTIPKEVYDNRVTREFRLVLNEKWAKEHNGDMLIVKIGGLDFSYPFEIDSSESKLIVTVLEFNKQEESQDN